MRIKTVCDTHPDAAVYMLQASVTRYDSEKKYCTDESENAVYVQLDESNMYCTAGDSNVVGEHATRFVVELECNFDENDEYIGF